MNFRLLLFSLLFCVNGITQDLIYWSPPSEISGSEDGRRARIDLMDDGTPVVMFAKYFTNYKDLYFTKWNGSDFSTPLQLNDVTLLTYDWGGTEMSVEGNNIYVVFKEDNVTTGRVFIRHSSDGGDNWGPKIMVEDSLGELAMYPNVLAYDGDKVLMTYMIHGTGGSNPQYILKTSTDNGQTFSGSIQGSEGFGDEACYCCPSNLAINDDYAVLLYRNDDNNIREMKTVISTDGALSFDQYASVDNFNWYFNSCPSSGADMELLNSTVYTTYMSQGEGEQNIYITKDDLSSPDPFSYVYAVHPDSADNVNHPVLTMRGDTIISVWQQTNSLEQDIWFNFSTTELAQWDETKAKPVFEMDGVQNLPDAIIDDNGTIHLVFTDINTNEIMYTTGTFTALGIEDEQLLQFAIYPNPAHDQLSLKGIGEDQEVTVTDVSGKIIFQTQGNQIDVSSLKQGLYYIKIEGFKVETLIIE